MAVKDRAGTWLRGTPRRKFKMLKSRTSMSRGFGLPRFVLADGDRISTRERWRFNRISIRLMSCFGRRPSIFFFLEVKA
jgi:hypothetical protein